MYHTLSWNVFLSWSGECFKCWWITSQHFHQTTLTFVIFLLNTEDSKRPVSFQNREVMGEEMEYLRAAIEDQYIHENSSNSTHPRSPRRRKRFLSYPRYVELMVTADAKMVRHHGRNLEHYILTIMSVVSKIMFLKQSLFRLKFDFIFLVSVLVLCVHVLK